MMAMANGCCISEPWPMANAKGSSVRIAAMVVMAMGRRWLVPARINDLR